MIPTLAPRSFLWWLLIRKRLTYLKSLKLLFRFEDYMEASWKLLGSLWGSRENIFEREVTFLILPSHWILTFSLVAQARKYPGVHNSTKIKIYDFFFFFLHLSHVQVQFYLATRFQAGSYFFWTRSSSPCFFIKESRLTLIFDSQTPNSLNHPSCLSALFLSSI